MGPNISNLNDNKNVVSNSARRLEVFSFLTYCLTCLFQIYFHAFFALLLLYYVILYCFLKFNMLKPRHTLRVAYRFTCANLNHNTRLNGHLPTYHLVLIHQLEFGYINDMVNELLLCAAAVVAKKNKKRRKWLKEWLLKHEQLSQVSLLNEL